MTPSAPDIEAWLLAQDRWVSAAELCAHFQIEERSLRSVGETPGLCSRFAVSGVLGLKHVRNATREEYLAFRHRIRRHAASEFRRTKLLDRIRHNVLESTVPLTEADSGQAILPLS